MLRARCVRSPNETGLAGIRPAIAKLWLHLGYVQYFSLRQMQCPPHRIG